MSPAVQPPAWVNLRLFPKLKTGASIFPKNLTIPWGTRTTTVSFRQHCQRWPLCNPYTSTDPQTGSTLQYPAKLRFWFFPKRNCHHINSSYTLGKSELQCSLTEITKFAMKSKLGKITFFLIEDNFSSGFHLPPRDAYYLLGLNSLQKPLERARVSYSCTYAILKANSLQILFPLHLRGSWETVCGGKWAEPEVKEYNAGRRQCEQGGFFVVSPSSTWKSRVLGIEICFLCLQMNLDF